MALLLHKEIAFVVGSIASRRFLVLLDIRIAINPVAGA
jgi:hypothetical protein